MATNGAKGDGRHGAVRERSQVLNPVTNQYVKRDSNTGRFMDVKELITNQYSLNLVK